MNPYISPWYAPAGVIRGQLLIPILKTLNNTF